MNGSTEFASGWLDTEVGRQVSVLLADQPSPAGQALIRTPGRLPGGTSTQWVPR